MNFFRKIINQLLYFYYQSFRNEANISISKISGTINKKTKTILVEGFWDNPHHWVRLGIFTRALRNQNLGNELVGLCETKDNKKIIKSMN